ncbi:MAG: lysophospholipid acyltransferase family protein [Pseudomonadota bacterium]
MDENGQDFGIDKSYGSLDSWVSASQSLLPEPLLNFARRFIAPDFDRRIELIMRRYHGKEYDPFGFDFNYAVYALVIAGLIYRYYFRVRMLGTRNIPEGKCMLVANHSGQIPIDGLMIGTGLLLDSKEPKLARGMLEKWTATLPFFNTFFQRCGQLTGRPENLKLLFKRDEMVLVFPEGARGIVKPYSQAYTLTEFGLGFMRLALETNCPIVPIAVVGAEEQYPSIANVKRVARLLGMPGLPFPVQSIIPIIGLLPLPSKYRIYIGEPMNFYGNPDDEDSVIAEKVWVVRHTIQLMLSKGLKERKHIFW